MLSVAENLTNLMENVHLDQAFIMNLLLKKQVRAQLEVQLQQLRQELIDKGQQHKQELVDLRLARDQEKHTAETEFNIQAR
jgi:hypothetical protein